MDAKRDLARLKAHLKNPDAAARYLEALRWPNGPVCPHCGDNRGAYRLRVSGSSRRVWKCAACRRQFSVTVGTIFERSHIPLHKWLQAFHYLCASKKGMSALQLGRMVDLTPKTAWFMAHRIRHAMAHPAAGMLGGVVEVDETNIGGKQQLAKKGRGTNKSPVVALVERGGGARSFHVKRVSAKELKGAIRPEIARNARVIIDSFSS